MANALRAVPVDPKSADRTPVPVPRADPLEETQQNPELPRLLAVRVARGLAHLTLDSATTTEGRSARGAARAALVYAAVLVVVTVAVFLRLSHG